MVKKNGNGKKEESKHEAPENKTPQNLPAPTPETDVGPPDFLKERMLKEAGRGISTASEDNIVPLVYVLQPLSPQLQKSKADKYIEGARAGDIVLKNGPTVPGELGILFQPCFFQKEFVEWIPRGSGGGFVARHKELPKDAVKKEDNKNANKQTYIRPNGNEVIETRYHIGLVHLGSQRLPYVIPFTSTGHTVSRNWMSAMANKRMENGEPMPSYASLYLLKTRERSNVQGTWYVLNPIDKGFVKTPADFELGSKINEAFMRGEKTVADDGDEPTVEALTGNGADDDTM